MAALTFGHYCRIKKAPPHELTSRTNPNIFIVLSCHGRRPVVNNSNPKEEKKDMGRGKLTLLKLSLLNAFEKVGKKAKQNLRQNLSPQQKGDWKDLLLMSLSFAVYVYISQKLVCAYFIWTSMPKQLW